MGHNPIKFGNFLVQFQANRIQVFYLSSIAAKKKQNKKEMNWIQHWSDHGQMFSLNMTRVNEREKWGKIIKLSPLGFMGE